MVMPLADGYPLSWQQNTSRGLPEHLQISNACPLGRLSQRSSTVSRLQCQTNRNSLNLPAAPTRRPQPPLPHKPLLLSSVALRPPRHSRATSRRSRTSFVRSHLSLSRLQNSRGHQSGSRATLLRGLPQKDRPPPGRSPRLHRPTHAPEHQGR